MFLHEVVAIPDLVVYKQFMQTALSNKFFEPRHLELDANDIASRINNIVELIVKNGEFERLAPKAEYYWDLAETLNITNEVDEILQMQSMQEMKEALKLRSK